MPPPGESPFSDTESLTSVVDFIADVMVAAGRKGLKLKLEELRMEGQLVSQKLVGGPFDIIRVRSAGQTVTEGVTWSGEWDGELYVKIFQAAIDASPLLMDAEVEPDAKRRVALLLSGSPDERKTPPLGQPWANDALPNWPNALSNALRNHGYNGKSPPMTLTTETYAWLRCITRLLS